MRGKHLILAGSAAVTIALLQLSAAPAAMAATTSSAAGIQGLGEWTANVTDSSGVPIDKYQVLPLDHGNGFGDFNPSRDGLVAVLDLLWGLHYNIVTTVMWLLHLVLSFSWVDWFAGPMENVGMSLGELVGRIHWIPFAAMVSSAVIALLFFQRKRGAAWGELVLSTVMVIVATNMALNPVAYITGPDGVLERTESYTAEITAEITSGKDELQQGADPGEVIAGGLMADLTDMLLRNPAQAVAFGELLQGGCNDVFTQTMSESDPLKVQDKTVMDPVKDCSEPASSWSESTSFTKVAPMLMVNLGSAAFCVLAVVLALIMFVAVLTALFFGLYQAISVLWAILPGQNRKEFLVAFVGVIACAVGMVATIVVVSIAIELLVEVLKATAALGVTAQMLLMVLVLCVLSWLMARVYKAVRQKGNAVAYWLARLGLSKDSPVTPRGQRMAQLGESGGVDTARAAASRAARRLRSPGRGVPEQPAPDGDPAGPSAHRRGPSGPPPSWPDGPGGPRPRAPRPPHTPQPRSRTAPALRAIGTGAATVGGPMGYAAAGAAHGVAWALNRSAERKELPAPKPKKVPRFSRIEIDKDGTATVKPCGSEVVEGTIVPPHVGPRTPRSTEASRRLRERLDEMRSA